MCWTRTASTNVKWPVYAVPVSLIILWEFWSQAIVDNRPQMLLLLQQGNGVMQKRLKLILHKISAAIRFNSDCMPRRHHLQVYQVAASVSKWNETQKRHCIDLYSYSFKTFELCTHVVFSQRKRKHVSVADLNFHKDES